MSVLFRMLATPFSGLAFLTYRDDNHLSDNRRRIVVLPGARNVNAEKYKLHHFDERLLSLVLNYDVTGLPASFHALKPPSR